DRVVRVVPDQRQRLVDHDLLAIGSDRDLHRIAGIGGGYSGADREETAWLGLGVDANRGGRCRTAQFPKKRPAQRRKQNKRPTVNVPHCHLRILSEFTAANFSRSAASRQVTYH